jgi:GDPmannose 4,6-dehydratase
MTKKALITGITGQDGSYLAEFLIDKGYEVHGVIRRSSCINTERIDHIYQNPDETGCKFFLHYGDLGDATGLRRIVNLVKPAELYNLAAQSHVKVSFQKPVYTADIVALGAIRLIEVIRDCQAENGRQIRFYQAGSSEMFGNAKPPQSEMTPFSPRSPYASAKMHAFWQMVNYREAYGLFAVNGILFNHESPRRGETFVTRKITRAASRIKLGLQDKLYLGNLDARRDWGFAGDYVEAMWLMLQQEQPDDYVIATGESHTVRDFLDLVFEKLSLDWRKYVVIDPHYFRPTEVDYLLGDITKAKTKLGWQPKTSFKQLIDMMVEHDLELAQKDKVLMDAGYIVESNQFDQ